MTLSDKLEAIQKIINDPAKQQLIHPSILQNIKKSLNQIQEKLRDRGLDEATVGSLANQNVTTVDLTEDAVITGTREFGTFGQFLDAVRPYLAACNQNLDNVIENLEATNSKIEAANPKNQQCPVTPLIDDGVKEAAKKLEDANESIDAMIEALMNKQQNRPGF
jgi:hypothetical protein